MSFILQNPGEAPLPLGSLPDNSPPLFPEEGVTAVSVSSATFCPLEVEIMHKRCLGSGCPP